VTTAHTVSRLRIAHSLPWSTVGGSEQATVRLARAAEGEEFTSSAFCLPDARPVRKLFEREGIPAESARQVARIITTSPEAWLKTMAEKELGLSVDVATD